MRKASPGIPLRDIRSKLMAESVTNLNALAPPQELRRPKLVPSERGLGGLTDHLTAFAEGRTPLW